MIRLCANLGVYGRPNSAIAHYEHPGILTGGRRALPPGYQDTTRIDVFDLSV